MKRALLLIFAISLCSVTYAYSAPKVSYGNNQPTTCNPANGDFWIDTNGTAGNRLYICTGTNTYTINDGLASTKAPALGADDNYVTDSEKIKLSNLTGTNTGDQNAAGVSVADAGGYYTGTNVEAILQEIGLAGFGGGSVDLSAYLSKTNTTAFTPSGDYHPATKKYVDDSITAGGGYTDEQAQDAVGGMFAGNTETGITVTYDDTTGKVNFVVATQSDVNFTSTLNTKLAGIATGAEVNVNADWNSSSGDSQILNKPTETPISASIVTNLFTGTGDCLGKNGQAVDCGGSEASAIADLTDWPSGLTATELGYANGVTGPIQSQIDAISAGGIPHVASGYPSTSGAWNFNTTDYKLYTRLANGSVYSTASLTSVATADVTPEGFAFIDVTDATLSTEYTACDQVTGIDWPATVTASSNAVAVCTGNNTGCGTFGTSPGTVENNGWVCARHTSSASNSTATNTPVTVGTVSDTFTTTTVAAQAGLTPTFYFNANSNTSGQTPTIGTGTITVGTGTAAVAGVVGNALEIDSTWGGSLNFTASGNISATSGTLGFYIFASSYVQNGAIVSSGSMNSPYFIVEPGASVKWKYMNGGLQEIYPTGGEWVFIEVSWNYTTARKSYRLNGGLWQEVTGLTGAVPTIGNVVFGSADGNVTTFLVDQIMITAGYQDDVYSIRNNTSF